MGAITGTKVYAGEYAGEVKELLITATVAAASDTITLTAANHGGVTEIVGLKGVVITGGADAAFCIVQAAFSGLVITLTSLGADGLAATDFTGTTVSVSLLIKTTA
jgi:hypothetical protein